MDDNFRTKGTVSKRITFPFTAWEEFEKDCQEHFNDTYFLKIMHDHEFHKTFQSTAAILADKVTNLEVEVDVLRQELAQVQQPQEDKKEKKTFG